MTPAPEVTTASRARQAMRQVRQVPVDTVLLDIRMPEVDGFELLEALRKEDPWITVIMMTAFGSIEIAVEAMRLGAYDFITKPFAKEPLLRAVRKGLERNRLIRENRHLRLRVADTDGFAGLLPAHDSGLWRQPDIYLADSTSGAEPLVNCFWHDHPRLTDFGLEYRGKFYRAIIQNLRIYRWQNSSAPSSLTVSRGGSKVSSLIRIS